MKYNKFKCEKNAINDFIKLPQMLYSRDTNMEDVQQTRSLLLGSHVLSKYFHLDKFLIYQEEKIAGRFCITSYPDDDTAYIGFFECINNSDVAKYLFDTAYDFAKDSGFKKIVGPVDASFWIKYRLKINMFDHIPYTCEPYNKEFYFEFFKANQYEVIEHYTSNIFPIIDDRYYNGKFEIRYESYLKKGYKIISPDIRDYDKIIEELYYMIIELYSDFPIFKMLSLDDFRTIFDSYKYIIKMNMIKMAYYENKAVGFFISIPNYYNKVYHINIINILKIFALKYKPKEYVMLYMGVDRNHTGLGKAIVGAIEDELKRNKKPSIGALARDGKITQRYAEEIVDDKFEYVLLERKIYD